jgi:hypothetical protein
MNERDINSIIAETARFAVRRATWPHLVVMWALTLLESFSKPFLRHTYVFLPGSLFGTSVKDEFFAWVKHIVPDELMTVLDQPYPEENLPAWLSAEMFRQINTHIGFGISWRLHRRRWLRTLFVPGWIVGVVIIGIADICCVLDVYHRLEGGDYDSAALIGLGYLGLMAIIGLILGICRRP